MATATYERPEAPATITLVLTEEEALYVFGALDRTTPVPSGRFGGFRHDPVYSALLKTLQDAGVGLDYSYVAVT